MHEMLSSALGASGFSGGMAFNQGIGAWNTSSVTTMEDMFYKCESLAEDLSGWNVANVLERDGIFAIGVDASTYQYIEDDSKPLLANKRPVFRT